MTWIMVRSWEWLESPDPEKARRLIPLLVFLQSPGKVVGGSITFEGKDMLALTKKEMQRISWE